MIALAFFVAPSVAAGPETALDHDPRVHRVTWAQRFELEQPTPYRHTAAAREIREGWLVELSVDPDTMVPRQVGVPLLWIGDTLAVRTNWDHRGGCAVAWVPGAHDLRNEPVFFGTSELPERIDAERAALEHETARAKGWGAVPVQTLEAEPLKLPAFRDLMRVAADRIEACSEVDDDRLPALRAR